MHLAWVIQPARDLDFMRRVNVTGSQRVFDAARAAGVTTLVVSSSVGAYGLGPKDRRVNESHPTTGIPTSPYSRQKSEVERRLDAVEQAAPDLRVVRIRPGLVLQHDAGAEISRYFLGRFVPGALVRPGLVPIVPDWPRLRAQAVHSDDVARAFALAVVTAEARGAFNVAAEPVLGPAELGAVLKARPVPLPVAAVRALVDLTWRLHLQPTDPGWLDMALGVPLMSMDKAHEVLGWQARVSATDALAELLVGIRHGAGRRTAPLRPAVRSASSPAAKPAAG